MSVFTNTKNTTRAPQLLLFFYLQGGFMTGKNVTGSSNRELIAWSSASSAARQWWTELEGANSTQPELVGALARALATRAATLDDFYMICAYSNRVGALENLKLLDVCLQDASQSVESSARDNEVEGRQFFH